MVNVFNAVVEKWLLKIGVTGKSLLGSGLTGLISNVTNRTISLAGAVVLARFLGPEGYGSYAFAIALMAVLSLGTEFGMYGLLIRETASAHLAKDFAEVRGLRKSAFAHIGKSSIVIFLLGVVIVWPFEIVSSLSDKILMTVMLVALPILTMVRISASMLNGLHAVKRAQLIEQLILPLTVFFAAIILIYVSALYVPSDVRPAFIMISQILGGIIALLVASRWISGLLPGNKNDVNLVRGLQVRSQPFVLIGAATLLTGQVDTVLVHTFVGDAETGIYRVAAQMAMLNWFGIQVFQSVCAPYFARYSAQGNKESLKKLFHLATLASIATAGPVSISYWLFGDDIINLVFGSGYDGASYILSILTVGYLINITCGPAGILLSMSGEERLVSRILMITSAINIALCATMGHWFGLIGIATSTSFTIALYHLMMRYFIWSRLRM